MSTRHAESVNKKIRNAQLLQINYMLTVGDKEVENKTITLRTRDNVVHGEIELDDFISTIEKENGQRSLTSSSMQKRKLQCIKSP